MNQVDRFESAIRLLAEEREAIISGDESLAFAKNSEAVVCLADLEQAEPPIPDAFWDVLLGRLRENRMLRGSGRFGVFPF